MKQSHTDNSAKDKKVTVIVTYTGKEDFQEEFSPNASLQSVKNRAMNKFKLEPSADGKYGLQFNGADVDLKRKVEDFGVDPVNLSLVFLEDQTKG